LILYLVLKVLLATRFFQSWFLPSLPLFLFHGAPLCFPSTALPPFQAHNERDDTLRLRICQALFLIFLKFFLELALSLL